MAKLSTHLEELGDVLDEELEWWDTRLEFLFKGDSERVRFIDKRILPEIERKVHLGARKVEAHIHDEEESRKQKN